MLVNRDFKKNINNLTKEQTKHMSTNTYGGDRMEINFVNGFEIIGINTNKYNGKLETPIGTSFLNTFNKLEYVKRILKGYGNKYNQDERTIKNESTLLNIISEIKRDLLEIDLDNLFINLVCDRIYDFNIEYVEVLTYKQFTNSLILALHDIIHSETIFDIHFMFAKRTDLILIEIPACRIYQSYIDKNNNIIQNKKYSEINEKDKYYITFNTIYKINKIEHYFSAYFKYFLDNKITINKCQNCGKFFIPSNRTDEKYCSNTSPQNPQKTCKEYGVKKAYRDNLNSDIIRKAHYNTSQYFRMKINRCKNEKEREKIIKEFEKYKANYEKNKKKFDRKKITEIEFSNWIIKQKNIKKAGEKDEHKRKS